MVVPGGFWQQISVTWCLVDQKLYLQKVFLRSNIYDINKNKNKNKEEKKKKKKKKKKNRTCSNTEKRNLVATKGAT